MTKANITQYSSTPSSNSDINDINIAENCPASNINNAIRELMAHLKNVDTGSQALTALSVTGALSCGAFTSNGIDDNADATAMTISSDEDVMIGTTDESSGAKFIVGSTDDDKRAFIQGSNQYRLGLKNGSNNHVWLGSGGADNFRVSNSSGSTLFELNSSGNIVLPSSNAGIHLGVTSATASNLLDDYEEGDFTPAFSFTNGNGGITTSTAIGKYVKTSNFVYFNIYIRIDSKGSASGQCRIGGIPFTPLNLSNYFQVISVGFNGTVSGQDFDGDHPYWGQLQANDATLRFYAHVGSGSIAQLGDSDVKDGTDIRATGGYFV